MRNKFTDLIADGVAQFDYINTITDVSDPICREYNNIYGIFSDTHMSKYKDGYIITGHMRGSDFDSILNKKIEGVGYFSMYDFFYKYNLSGGYNVVNNDKVYILKPKQTVRNYDDNCSGCTPQCYYEGNSNIPLPIISITTNNDINKLNECFDGIINSEDVAEKLNKSPYIKGNNWIAYNGNIYGVVNNKNVRIFAI